MGMGAERTHPKLVQASRLARDGHRPVAHQNAVAFARSRNDGAESSQNKKAAQAQSAEAVLEIPRYPQNRDIPKNAALIDGTVLDHLSLTAPATSTDTPVAYFGSCFPVAGSITSHEIRVNDLGGPELPFSFGYSIT